MTSPPEACLFFFSLSYEAVPRFWRSVFSVISSEGRHLEISGHPESRFLEMTMQQSLYLERLKES